MQVHRGPGGSPGNRPDNLDLLNKGIREVATIMGSEHILYEKKNRIVYITINRPEAMNALNASAQEELHKAWTDFRDDSELWVAILTGAGDRAFCTGNDLKATTENPLAVKRTLERIGASFGTITSRFECWKPIIAAVNGHALGGGMELALACDIIVASENAKFALPEVKVGRAAMAGGLQRLPRSVPLKIAMGMILTGKPMGASEALHHGLVNEVVPQSQLLAAANRWAEDILECAPLSVRVSKEMVKKSLECPLDVALTMSPHSYNTLVNSEDYKEGPRSFAEKRRPQWKGK